MRLKQSSLESDAARSADAGFVFQGTIRRVKDSTVPNIKPDAATAVVHVDEVVAAPPALARTAGRDITVIGASGDAFKVGQRAVFHTSSVSFGDEIAVRAVRAQPLPAGATGGIGAARAAAAPLAAAHTAATDPVQAHRDLQLKRSLDEADVVIAGTVTDVRMAAETVALTRPLAAPAVALRAGASRRMGAGNPTTTAASTRISEHDPLWHEAVVKVESVEKGLTTQKEVVVRFPGSNDVRWRAHPKFRPGQQGVFLLNTTSTRGAPAPARRGIRAGRATATAALTAAPLLETTIRPEPISAIERVRQLLRAAPAAARPTAKATAPATRRAAAPRRAAARPARKRR